VIGFPKADAARADAAHAARTRHSRAVPGRARRAGEQVSTGAYVVRQKDVVHGGSVAASGGGGPVCLPKATRVLRLQASGRPCSQATYATMEALLNDPAAVGGSKHGVRHCLLDNPTAGLGQ
jgi:hypothetical protein